MKVKNMEQITTSFLKVKEEWKGEGGHIIKAHLYGVTTIQSKS
jgi:hypothetical protein